MKLDRFFCLSITILICSLTITGCETVDQQIAKQQIKQPIKLQLRFAENDTTTYKLISENARTVNFVGPLSKKASVKGGYTGAKVEMIFDQKITSIDENGDAIAVITLKELTYLSKVKDKLSLSFDIIKDKDRNAVMAKLIGQTYKIKISPDGKITKVIDAKNIKHILQSSPVAKYSAQTLFSKKAIQRRHGVSALENIKEPLQVGSTWSNIKTFPFGFIMGTKSYEKIYKLKEVKDSEGKKLAIVEMKAIPTLNVDEQNDQQMLIGTFQDMLDSTEKYTGYLEFDINSGKVQKYFEKMDSKWVMVDPDAKPENENPSAIRMGVIDYISIEKID